MISHDSLSKYRQSAFSMQILFAFALPTEVLCFKIVFIVHF
uniref:Uncharacterized protein n=1 Tax=Anopheles arabiensis TaxID=7173 RepID=A0A182IFC4_ANOAR